jgi:hypothetical protein
VRDEQPTQGNVRRSLREWWGQRRSSSSVARLYGWPVSTHKAHVRGMRLLIENLSGAQRAEYERCNYFEVIGGTTGNRYRIRTGYQMNVEELDKKGRVYRLLCFMPVGHLPIGDTMLGQKLALELFEREALRAANRAHNPFFTDAMA